LNCFRQFNRFPPNNLDHPVQSTPKYRVFPDVFPSPA
jgi:hypothetical protein